jgi:hypothetical protein
MNSLGAAPARSPARWGFSLFCILAARPACPPRPLIFSATHSVQPSFAPTAFTESLTPPEYQTSDVTATVAAGALAMWVE